jgi:hypothetical protein
MTAQQDEVLRTAEKINRVAEFAMHVLGIEDRYADMFVKSQLDRFDWTGTVLMFNGPNGPTVAVDDPNCAGFFKREYPKLMPTENTEQRGAVNPALVAAAKTGSVTAKGQLFTALHGDRIHTPREDAKTMEELERVLKDSGAQDDGGRDRDDKGRFEKKNNSSHKNPFSREGWNLTEQGRIAKADLTLAQGLAKSAGVTLGATRPRAA